MTTTYHLSLTPEQYREVPTDAVLNTLRALHALRGWAYQSGPKPGSGSRADVPVEQWVGVFTLSIADDTNVPAAQAFRVLQNAFPAIGRAGYSIGGRESTRRTAGV